MPARTLLSLAVLAALAAGCSATTTADAPATTETIASEGTPARNVAVETSDGQVSLSLDGQLPPNWPSDFPLPPGATPAGSGSLLKGDSGGMVAAFRITGTPQETFAFYMARDDLGITDSSSVGLGGAYLARARMTGSYEGSVSVGGASAGDLLVVVLKGEPSEVPGTTAATATTGSSPT
jgi:hypothetical protein